MNFKHLIQSHLIPCTLTGECLDILAISCDSFNPETNEVIGRQQGKKNHLKSLTKVRDLCTKYKVYYIYCMKLLNQVRDLCTNYLVILI